MALVASWVFRCLCAIAAIWAAVSLTYPPGWDQGIFSWVAGVISDGGMPYRDAWDIKGPIVYYIYALAGLLSGTAVWGARLIDLVFLTGSVLVLKTLVTKLTDETIGRWTAVLFVLWYASGSYWHTAQPDGWAAMAMICAIGPAAILDRPIRDIEYFAAGLFISAATLMKPMYILFALPLLIAIFFRRDKQILDIIRPAAIVAAGIALPLGICIAWFAYQGALSDLVDVWLIYPPSVYANVKTSSPYSRLTGLMQFFAAGTAAPIAAAAALFGSIPMWKNNRRAAASLLSWLVLAIFFVLLQDRYFLYHWLIVYPPLAILGAYGFFVLLCAPANSRLSRLPLRQLSIAGLVLLVAAAAARPGFEASKGSAYAAGFWDTSTYYRAFGKVADSLLAAEHIRLHTSPDDRIVVWGWNVKIAALSGRRTVSRFGYSMPLLMGQNTGEREAYRKEFLDAVLAGPPAYIVVAPQSHLIMGAKHSLDDFPEFAKILLEGYYREKQFGDLALYRRRAGYQNPRHER